MIASPFPDQRQSQILRTLFQEGRVLAGELARRFGTSEDTIRRDLRDMAAAGLCRRVYGGALPVSPASAPLRQRMEERSDIKAALGRAAAALVGPHETVMIDAGSTNLSVADALPSTLGLTVVTNAPSIAARLFDRGGIEVVMIGGPIDRRTGACFGARACAEMAELSVDIAFVGTCAVAADGLRAFDRDEAVFKRLVIAGARRAVAAVTSEKLSTAAPFRFAALSDLETLVVEPDAPAGRLDELGLPRARIHRAAQTHAQDRS